MDIKLLTIEEFFFKIKLRIHNTLYIKNRHNISVADYFKKYSSYRYSLAHQPLDEDKCKNYLAARPNPGAGIGHQMANWMAGYYYASFFNLQFAHIPFSNDHYPLKANQWETFLGFGEGEPSYVELKKKGYKEVVLPLFDSKDHWQVDAIRKIINSFSDKKIIFRCEQDQFLKDLYLVSDDIKRKFETASARNDVIVQYDKQKFNIAVHVRRTVVIDGKTIVERPEVRELRWLSNDYYEKVLKQVLETIQPNKPIAIWLFSTGKAEEFSEFAQYGEVHFCNDMDEYLSFAHLVYADLLITSKSSFSYKPALMNNGIKVCPRNFWHGYPEKSDWILCENDGTFNTNKLRSLFNHNAD